MRCTRPDISYAVSVLSRHMHEPREIHWRFVKRLLKYVKKKTKNVRLVYKKSNEPKLIGYSDSDFARDVEDRKSTSGYAFNYGECLISWNSSKQKSVSLSSTEAEYIAITTASKEGIWINQLLDELKIKIDIIKLFCDNKSAILLASNPEFHSRTKHIDIRVHYVRSLINNKSLCIEFMPTDLMIADILTKGLPKLKHNRNMSSLNLQITGRC